MLDIDEVDPKILITKFKDPQTDKVWGYSKWFLNDGNFDWRKCEVLDYKYDSERFEIKWENGKTKLVSRLNLRFEKE